MGAVMWLSDSELIFGRRCKNSREDDVAQRVFWLASSLM